MPERASVLAKASPTQSSSGSKSLAVGDNVLVRKLKARGMVRFIGQTKFSSGDWIGIELTEAVGKNDGSVQGVQYFECQPQHGIFVHPEMCEKEKKSNRPHSAAPAVAQAGERHSSAASKSSSVSPKRSPAVPKQAASPKRQAAAPRLVEPPRPTLAIASVLAPAPLPSALATSPSESREARPLKEGQAVSLLGLSGTVRFIGETRFAEGVWLGVELDEAEGGSSGSVQGVEYFSCAPDRGLFVQAPRWSAGPDKPAEQTGARRSRPAHKRLETVPMSQDDEIVVENSTASFVVMGPDGPIEADVIIERLEHFEVEVQELRKQLQEARANEQRLQAELDSEKSQREARPAGGISRAEALHRQSVSSGSTPVLAKAEEWARSREYVDPLEAAERRRAADESESFLRPTSPTEVFSDLEDSDEEAEDLTQYLESF